MSDDDRGHPWRVIHPDASGDLPAELPGCACRQVGGSFVFCEDHRLAGLRAVRAIRAGTARGRHPSAHRPGEGP